MTMTCNKCHHPMREIGSVTIGDTVKEITWYCDDCVRACKVSADQPAEWMDWGT